MENTWIGPPLNHPEPVIDDYEDDAVLQISGAGHWFLEGWISDHSVEFLVDSGSSVTAMSDSLYKTLVYAGAPVGTLGCTSRTLRGANGTGIGVSGCSNLVVSFMGLLTEFPILVCDLASGTDAIIGTDVLGLVLPAPQPGNREWPAVYRRRLFVTVTPQGCHTFRSRFHSWTLFCSSLFRGCLTLYCTYCWWTPYAL